MRRLYLWDSQQPTQRAHQMHRLLLRRPGRPRLHLPLRLPTPNRTISDPMTGNRRSISKHREDGCTFHNHCLTCPLPKCRYDYSSGTAALADWNRAKYHDTILTNTVAEAARILNISVRTVIRYLDTYT